MLFEEQDDHVYPKKKKKNLRDPRVLDIYLKKISLEFHENTYKGIHHYVV